MEEAPAETLVEIPVAETPVAETPVAETPAAETHETEGRAVTVRRSAITSYINRIQEHEAIEKQIIRCICPSFLWRTPGDKRRRR